MKKTKYDSYLRGKFPKGCELCVNGEKMVLFVTGLCSRNCEFCPLSKLRKNIDKVYSNERKINFFREIIKEVEVSRAKGCSLTGGDPLLKLNRTILLSKKLKEKFGKSFHIHIYVSTKLVDEKKLRKLSKHTDEIRFHPDLNKCMEEEIRKISLAKKFWNLKDIGLEIPLFPDKKKKIYEFIKKCSKNISFVNLNELESGEFSEEILLKKYKLTKEGYTIKNSITSGKWIIRKLEKDKLDLNIHLCTARLKSFHQYKNRLKNYKINRFSKKTDEGTIIYFFVKDKEQSRDLLNKRNFIEDKMKKRLILNPCVVKDLIKKTEVYRVEEYPTYEREEVDLEILK